LRVARFNRVASLAWEALASQRDELPADLAQSLSGEAAAIVAANLAVAAQCAELDRAFAQSQTAVLFLKGLTLGALAYRSAMLKAGWDIDILIDPKDLGTAAELLSSRGYVLITPASRERLEKWHARHKESLWRKGADFHVDLHTRLADNPAIIPATAVHSPSQAVEISPGIALPTLADDHLFAYLSVHGASSAWFRLKWISDFAAFVAGRSRDDLERLYQRSQELGAGRAASQALLLADRLFGSLNGTALRAKLEHDHGARLLAAAAFRQLAGQAFPREPTETSFGTWRIHWTQLFLMRGLKFKIGEIVRQIRDAISAKG
jgi:hypothetical protein